MYNALINKCSTRDINNSFSYGVLQNRVSMGIFTINAYDSNNSGLSIDFNFDGGYITVYKVINGVTQGIKNVAIV